jgi:hypothetical protein
VAANLDRFARAEKLENHEWEAAGHNDVDEFGVAEFLAQEGAAPSELIKIKDETSTDRRLPVRQNPLRDHRGPAVGVYLPLHRLPAPNE